MKYIKFIGLSVVLLLSFESISSAQEPQPQHFYAPCVPGSETLGYIVNCGAPRGHAGTVYITFKDTFLPPEYQGYVTQALTRWNITGVTNITRVISSPNEITTYVDHNTDNTAVTITLSIDSYFHKVSWKIKFNTVKMGSRSDAANLATATHEFGHAIGLADLSNTQNNNKIMYGFTNRTVTTPQPADITGAKEAVK